MLLQHQKARDHNAAKLEGISLQKSERELSIFKQFALIIGLQDGMPNSQEPPAPDILFEGSDGSSISFELTEVRDKSFSRNAAGNANLKQAVCESFEQWTEPHKTIFNKKFSNADIEIHPKANSNLNKFRKLFPSVFHYLMDLPLGYSGNPDKRSTEYSSVEINIIRHSSDMGPNFSVDSPGWGGLGKPVEDIIGSKNKKSYVSQYPIELVLYYASSSTFPESQDWNRVYSYLKGVRDSLQFNKIWVVDIDKQKLEFFYQT